MYINLLTRSHYSMSKSSISIDDIIKHACDNKLPYACLIDIDVMYGALEFYSKCLENNLKPVIGLSIKIDEQDVILVAKNYDGYIKLCSISSIINHNQKVDLQQFAGDDLIVISDFKAPGFANYYNPKDLAIHEALFANKSDFSKYKALIAINQGCLYDDVKIDNNYECKYIYTQEKAQEEFSKQQLDNLDALLKQVDLKIELNKANHFVQFDKKHNSWNLLQERCRQGLIKRFGEKISKKYMDRIKYELGIIHKMGFDDYFLVVQDYVAYAKQNNIMVGPGRGSAAGSLVSYVLEITNIDPIKYGLIFERFLNSHRKTKPDIDIDFMDNRRQEIFDYLFSKYGNDHVAHIITFQKIKIKTAIRDIARILDIDLRIVNKICQTVSDWFDEDIDETAKKNKTLADYMDKYPLLFELAKFIMGMPRQIGTHAAGVVICNQPLSNVVPTTLSAEGINTTQYSMEWIEPVGLIKMDILGLVNLSIINDCVDEINKSATKKFDINQIPLDDQKVFKQLCDGKTIGVFQLESPGMTRVVQRIHPQSIEDISIASALFRPGPQANIPLYVDNKKHPDQIKYIDNRLIPVVEPTYGIIVYQEQVIQTLCLVANWSLAEADIVRRAISKKKIDKLYEIKNNFIEAAIKNDYSKEKAQEIFEYLMKFASYGFNHSHSIAYALISYQLAYLKQYYPLEFYACLLTYNNNSTAKITSYLKEAWKNGITILPPDINHSKFGFSLYQKKIIFGFSALKGLGAETISKILLAKQKAGQWSDLKTCFKDLAQAGVGSAALTILAKAGCFDQLLNDEVPNRSSLIASVGEIHSAVKSYSDKYGFLKNINYIVVQDNKETSKKENEDQYDILGVSFSAHPIAEIKACHPELEKEVFSLKTITEGETNARYKTLVYINSVRRLKTKTGIDMAFISLEDETMEVSDATAFGSVLTDPESGPLLAKENYLVVEVTKTSRSIKLNKIIKEIKP